ncbi:ganglioside GM2 activator-like [Ischnura elegans]|uniref:ganglioside GM2 activator-like n=1 Tax=Ischnura elegans TaxID=197161 RepID=UPI001ED8AC35|nr:ganglioside GM2 activator-like [Ischnura elegans]
MKITGMRLGFQLVCCLLLLSESFWKVSAGFLSKRKVRIKSIKFADCGTSADPVRVVDLQVSTSEAPTEENEDLGGDLVISGKITSSIKLNAPIKAEVQMQRKMLGVWMHVFCIKKFGSCDFNDVCAMAPSDGYCPPLLEEHDIPCSCPIEPGTYNLPIAQFKVKGTRWAGIMAGTYRGTVRFKGKDGKQIACVAANFQLD